MWKALLAGKAAATKAKQLKVALYVKAKLQTDPDHNLTIDGLGQIVDCACCLCAVWYSAWLEVGLEDNKVWKGCTHCTVWMCGMCTSSMPGHELACGRNLKFTQDHKQQRKKRRSQ